MIAVILFTMVLYPTPTYTYSEGKNLLSKELGKTVSQTTYGRRKALPSRLDNIYIDCIDYVYIFEVIDNGNITTYAVDPLSGAWDEVYYPPFGDWVNPVPRFQLNFPYLYEPNTPHLDTNTSLGQYFKEIALREP